MKGKLPQDYNRYKNVQNSDLLLTQLDADDSYKGLELNNAIPFYTLTSDKIDYESTGSDGIWWEELARTTLASAADDIDVSFPAKKFLKIIIKIFTTGGTCTGYLTFNSDTNLNYNHRYSDNGAADTTSEVSASRITVIGATSRPLTTILDVINIADQEKLIQFKRLDRGTSGAGNAPNRQEAVCKWVNTTDQITSLNYNNTGTGQFDTDSEIIVLGHD